MRDAWEDSGMSERTPAPDDGTDHARPDDVAPDDDRPGEQNPAPTGAGAPGSPDEEGGGEAVPMTDEQRAVAELLERETAYGLLQRGNALMRRRHYAQAAVLLERAARLEPRRGSIIEALGRACYNSGQHERAAEVFAELLEVDPSLPYAHFALGQSLKRLGRTDVARTHLRLAVALAPDSRLYRNALARLEGPQPPTVL
jgi:tetratricopeptide (TPR) repeat protein